VLHDIFVHSSNHPSFDEVLYRKLVSVFLEAIGSTGDLLVGYHTILAEKVKTGSLFPKRDSAVVYAATVQMVILYIRVAG
jgi:hypothetical protein